LARLAADLGRAAAVFGVLGLELVRDDMMVVFRPFESENNQQQGN
jgi:hypothetical protein